MSKFLINLLNYQSFYSEHPLQLQNHHYQILEGQRFLQTLYNLCNKIFR